MTAYDFWPQKERKACPFGYASVTVCGVFGGVADALTATVQNYEMFNLA